MSFLVKKGSQFIFGSAGIDREMHESDYVRTLCTVCIDRHTEEEACVDLHLTLPQLKELMLACTSVLSEFLSWTENKTSSRDVEPLRLPENLDPCSHCGADPAIWRVRSSLSELPLLKIVCTDDLCDSRLLGKFFGTLEEAVSDWNQRRIKRSFWYRKSVDCESIGPEIWHCCNPPDYSPLCGHSFPTGLDYSQTCHGIPESSFCPECKELLLKGGKK